MQRWGLSLHVCLLEQKQWERSQKAASAGDPGQSVPSAAAAASEQRRSRLFVHITHVQTLCYKCCIDSPAWCPYTVSENREKMNKSDSICEIKFDGDRGDRCCQLGKCINTNTACHDANLFLTKWKNYTWIL